jgi:hypothetical protein
MALNKTESKHSIVRILAWMAILPALACWPIVSALPAFAMIGGGLSITSTIVNILLFLTGFWALLTLLLVFLAVRAKPWAGRPRTTRRADRGLMLGAYATIWSALYALAAASGV